MNDLQWERTLLTMRIVLYTTLALLAFLVISGKAFAATLTIVNHTGVEARIDHLRNRCDDELVKRTNPIVLKNNESVSFQVAPVIQIFDICSNGLCSSSAMGMKKSSKYTLEIVLKGGWVETNATPDHWTGSNKECPK